MCGWHIFCQNRYQSRSLTRAHADTNTHFWYNLWKPLPWGSLDMDLRDGWSSDVPGFTMWDEPPEGQANFSLGCQPFVMEKFTGRILEMTVRRSWEKKMYLEHANSPAAGLKAELERWIPQHFFQSFRDWGQEGPHQTQQWRVHKSNVHRARNNPHVQASAVYIWQNCSTSWSWPPERNV